MTMLRAALHAFSGWFGLGMFWVREIVGWVLVVLGLWVLAQAVALLYTPMRLIAATQMTFIGVIVFRGGIHLLKVATAAQVCLRAQRQVDKAPSPASPSLLATPFELGRRNPVVPSEPRRPRPI